MKIKCIVVTCEKYHNTRVKSIQETWGTEIETLFLSDINLGQNIIGFEYLPTGYHNLWMKFEKFFLSFDFTDDWYLFCDDDTFVNVNNINNLISTRDNEDVCLGFICHLKPGALDEFNNYTGFPLHSIAGDQTYLPLTYPSGGAGFLLNKNSAIRVQNYLKSLKESDILTPQAYNSDVTIGFWIRNAGIKLEKIEGFCPQNPENMEHSLDIVPNSYTYHYINPERMYELNQFVNEKV